MLLYLTRGYPRTSVISHHHPEKNPEEDEQWNYKSRAASQVEGELRQLGGGGREHLPGDGGEDHDLGQQGHSGGVVP